MIKHILVLGLEAMLLASWLTAGDPTAAQQPAPEPAAPAAPDPGFEVLARGQVHEAFAEAAVGRPLPSPLVPKQPPPPIEEMPPDQKPDGVNVQWINGYWAWDVDTANFIWISGLWRNLPPGRQWLPGNWGRTADAWQWTRGFWAEAAQKDLQLLPAPPPSIDNGPSAAAPSVDSDYVAGCWVWRDTRYLWRPGFWHGFQSNWIWTPAHYVWTPGGYLFAEGYWDYPLGQRGLLFAPVRFDRPLWNAAGWFFRPRYAIYNSGLLGALFVRPDYASYYFGDYFDNRYSHLGLVPWVDYRIGRTGYDPLYSHYRWNNRGRPWERDMVALYAGRRTGDIPRPPVTIAQQTTVIKSVTNNITTVNNLTLLAPLDQVDKNVIKLHPVSQAEQAHTQQYIQQVKAAGQQREKLPSHVEGVPGQPTDKPRPVKIDLPKPLAPVGAASIKAPLPPALPAHVDRPIPKHEPVKPVTVAPHPLTSVPVTSPAKTPPPSPAPKVPAPPSALPKATAPPPKATAPPPAPADKGTPEKPPRP